MSSIQDKVFEKENNGSKEKDSNNWSEFFIYCLSFMIISLYILVLGSNFMFISDTSNDILNKLLPTDINFYFKQEQLDKQEGGGGASCKRPNFKVSNWPYSMRKSASNTKGILQSFKNWFADTTAETFIMNRGLIKSWINLFSPINNPIFMFFISIITIISAPLVFIGSLGTSIYNAFKTNWKWGLTSFFLIFLWPFTISISIIQELQYILLFIFIPALTDFDGLKGQIKCNINTFFTFFGGLVALASLLSLNNTITIVYTCLYLLINIISIL
jgi:hypothetical protein